MAYRSRLSIPALDLALRVAGARRLLTGAWRQRLVRTGIPEEEIDRTLAAIRSVRAWPEAWDRCAAGLLGRAAAAAPADEARRAARRAAAAALVSMGLTDPRSPGRARAHGRVRAAHRLLASRGPGRLERFALDGPAGPIAGFLHRPGGAGRAPLVLALPPLGHVKEEMGVVLAPLVEAGYAVAGLDLPGGGESPGPLPLDAERLASAAIDRLLAPGDLDRERVAVAGVSLGAYWAFKLAAADPRVRFAAGISTPVMDPRAWRRLPPRLWRAFEGAFATGDPRVARRLATRMTLEGVFQRVRCPVLLFHAGADAIPIRDAVPWLLARARAPVEAVVFPAARHGCVDHLEADVVPHLRRRLDEALPDAEARRIPA
jgi:pimeloyl-ACP methyl ester carboxylesterase